MKSFISIIKNKFKNMKLNRRLLYSYGIFFCVTLIILTAIQYFSTSRFLYDQILTSNSETIDQIILNINQYLNDFETYMFNLSTNKSLQNYLSSDIEKSGYEGAMEANEIVTNILSVDVFSKKTAGVFVYAEKQDSYPVYSSSNISMISGQRESMAVFRAKDIQKNEWYLQAMNNFGRISWRIPEWDAARGKTEFSATRVIINTKNLRESLGVIRVFVSTKYIQDLLNKVTLGKEGQVYLYYDGTLMNYEDDSSRNDVIKLVESGIGSIKNVRVGDTLSYVVSRDIGVSDWKLIGIVPASSINYQLDLLRSIVIAVLVFGLLITMIISHWIARSISKPIKKVADAMQTYDHNQQTKLDTDRKDEVGVLFSSYNRMTDDISRLLDEIKISSEKRRVAELHALQSQINPHFLYNTLDCISSLAYAKSMPEIAELTISLSDFFRISLNKGNEELPLRRELDHVISYCAIQKYRSSKPFDLIIDVPENLMNVVVIKLILQPLVENSIVHGFSKNVERGEIIITAKQSDQYLFLFVKDNGVAADVEYINGILSGEYRYISTMVGSSGYGIKNVNERIKLAFGEESKLYYIENDDGRGITAVIRIQLKGEILNAANN